MALTVVTSIPAVGTILVVSLLVAPPLTARLWIVRVGPMMGLSAGLGAAAGIGGIAASAQWGIAGGAAITLVATALLVVSAAGLSIRGAAIAAEAVVAVGGGVPVGGHGPGEPVK